jgi:hypothetical protein
MGKDRTLGKDMVLDMGMNVVLGMRKDGVFSELYKQVEVHRRQALSGQVALVEREVNSFERVVSVWQLVPAERLIPPS